VRILLVGTYPVDPTAFGGGVQASFANLVSGLADLADLETRVVSFVPGLDRATRVMVGSVLVDYLPGSTRLAYLTRWARERRSLRDVVREWRPDIVHAQDSLGSGYSSLKSVHGTPVLVTVHGIVREEVNHLSPGLERVRARLLAVPVERYSIRHARFLAAPTRYAEQYFGSQIRGRLWEIGNPIAERFFAIDPAPESGRILYTGAVIPRKRLLDLVETMPSLIASIPDVRLRVTGGGSDQSYERQVRSRVHELGLEARVQLLGSVSFGRLLEEFRRAAVLVLPSGEETSPMVIGEAMAASLPVVATRVGGVAYLVDDGMTGYLVEAGDVEALGERIAATLGDPDRQASLGAAGRAKADRGFRTAAVAARVRSVWEEVLAISRG
jgi:glycosyltransferase involved in cell wall biosynthesis